MRPSNTTRRAAVAGAIIAVIVIVVVAAAAGGFYLLSSKTSSSTTDISTSQTASIQATGSTVSSASIETTTSGSAASIVSTSSIGSQKFTVIFQNLASGYNNPQDLIGNYLQMSYTFDIKSLNHSSAYMDYNSTYSVVGQTTVNGILATKINVSSTNESTDGILLKNDTQSYTIDLDQNGKVIQLYNETSHTYMQNYDPDPELLLLTQATEVYYGEAISLFQNSTFLQQISTDSVTIGSTPMTVSSFIVTSAFYDSLGPGSNYFPGDTLAIDIGISDHGTTLYVPTSVAEIGEKCAGNCSSWEQITFTLTNIATA